LPAHGKEVAGRYRQEGLACLQDRSSRPHRLRKPTDTQIVKRIIALRRQRWTGKHIACQVGSRRRACARWFPSAERLPA